MNMWQVIQGGARQTVAADPKPLPCPCCNCPPSVEDGFHGQYVVFCDNDDCSGYGEKQAMGKTAAEAIALWNEREAEMLEAVGSGMGLR